MSASLSVPVAGRCVYKRIICVYQLCLYVVFLFMLCLSMGSIG